MKTGDSGASGQRCEPDEGVLELHFFFFFLVYAEIKSKGVYIERLRRIRYHGSK